MKKPKLGILGGLGPKASSLMLASLTEKTEAFKDQEHLDLILYSHASLMDRTEAILSGKEEEMREALLKDLLFLEGCECTHLVVGCNTAHAFLEGVTFKEAVFINMIDTCVQTLKRKYPGLKRVGLMSTKGTLLSGIYQKRFTEAGMDVVIPSEKDQELLMEFIHSIKAGEEPDAKIFFKIYTKLLKEADVVLTACTELSIHVDTHLYDNLEDSLDMTTDTILDTLNVKKREGMSHGHL